MSYYLFDNLTWLYSIAALALIASIIFYSVSQREKRFLALLVGPLLAAGAWGMDYSVETDREEVVSVIHKLVKSSVKPNVNAMLGTMHDDIYIAGKDLSQLSVLFRAYFRDPVFSSNSIKSMEIKSLTDSTAEVEFTALSVFDSNGEYAMAGMSTSKWYFTLAKDHKDRFRIISMVMLSLNSSEPMDVFQQKL